MIAEQLAPALALEPDLVALYNEMVREVADRHGARLVDLAWAKAHAAPWIRHRLTGTSSGVGLSPRRPEVGPL